MNLFTEDIDPWRTRYIYLADPKEPTGIWVSSAGPDRTPNTEDDIGVELPKQLPLVLKK